MSNMAGGRRLPKTHHLYGVVSEAYRVFRYPKPSTLGVCQNCWMDPRIEKDFLRPDIEALPLEYVRDRTIGSAWNGHGVELSFVGVPNKTVIVQSIYAGNKPTDQEDCLRLGIGSYALTADGDAS